MVLLIYILSIVWHFHEKIKLTLFSKNRTSRSNSIESTVSMVESIASMIEVPHPGGPMRPMISISDWSGIDVMYVDHLDVNIRSVSYAVLLWPLEIRAYRYRTAVWNVNKQLTSRYIIIAVHILILYTLPLSHTTYIIYWVQILTLLPEYEIPATAFFRNKTSCTWYHCLVVASKFAIFLK